MVRAAAVAAVFAAIAAACGDTPTAPHELASAFAVVVSNAVGYSAASTPAGATGAIAPDVASVGPIAFVSAVPATEPAGTTATILDRRTQESIQAPMVDGGFDPAGIAAEAGDTLDITIARSVGGPVFARSIVPASRPPRVVRTSPVQGRTDVAINATIAVIFSEPVDIATVNPTTLRLLKDGQPVAGTLRPLAGSSVGVEFVPAAPLAPTTGYTLAVGDGIADLTGDRLDEPVATQFVTTTADPASNGMLVFATQPADVDAFVPFVDHLRVTVLNGLGNPDQQFAGSITVSLDANPGDASLLGTTTVDAVNGSATFPNLGLSAPGAGYTLTVAAAGLRSGVSAPFAVTGTPTSWTLRAPPPTERYVPVAAAVDGKLYLIGGRRDPEGFAEVQTVEAFDPATNTWTAKAPMPTARDEFALAIMGGIIYAVGGHSNRDGWLATVEAYDPATDTWTTKAPMPTPRAGLVVGDANGTLLAVGGYNYAPGLRVLATVEAYDPVTNTWSVRTPMPTARFYPAVGVIGGTLYVAGGDGQDQGVTLAVVEAYDPSTNSWNSRASMPLAHFWPGFGVVGDRLYVIGGTNNDGRLGIVNSYDPVTDSWSVGPSVPKGDVTAAVVDGVIYAVVNGYAFAYRP
jgi:hypothetical protein